MTKLLRRLNAVGMVCTLAVLAYVAVPFWTAWSIREAIKGNDSAYLEHKIEWDTVRSTLKHSLANFAVTSGGDMTELPPNPTLWQKVKGMIAKGAVDRFVDTTVTPTGMNGLFTMRRAYQASVGGDDPAKRPALWRRIQRVWAHVTRAEFASLSRFEMDMIDKTSPDRTINCVLEIRGFEWKMTELRVKATAADKAAAFNKVSASLAP